MGSVSYHVPTGVTTKQAITDYLTEDGGAKILDLSVRGSTGYAVVENHRGEMFGLVAITSRDSRYHHNFNIKIVTEDMGPYYHGAPARILDLLDRVAPNPEGYAAEWRERCRDALARRAEARKVKPGATIRLAEPIPFTDGRERDTFTLVKGSTFRSADGFMVRVTGWRDREWEVVTAA